MIKYKPGDVVFFSGTIDNLCIDFEIPYKKAEELMMAGAGIVTEVCEKSGHVVVYYPDVPGQWLFPADCVSTAEQAPVKLKVKKVSKKDANALVTKDSLKTWLEDPDPVFVADVIGRAMCAIFEKQTASERMSNATDQNNGVGFTGADAKGGSLTAKSYMKNVRLGNSPALLEWQVGKWTRKASNGYPRLCRYADQLNTIALEKQANV